MYQNGGSMGCTCLIELFWKVINQGNNLTVQYYGNRATKIWVM